MDKLSDRPEFRSRFLSPIPVKLEVERVTRTYSVNFRIGGNISFTLSLEIFESHSKQSILTSERLLRESEILTLKIDPPELGIISNIYQITALSDDKGKTALLPIPTLLLLALKLL